MKYILSDLDIQIKQGWRCDHCKKVFWKGFNIRPLYEDNDFNLCKNC